MNEQLKLWLQDNPDMRKVKGDKYEDLLRWAHRKGFVVLTTFQGKLWYNGNKDIDAAHAAMDNHNAIDNLEGDNNNG